MHPLSQLLSKVSSCEKFLFSISWKRCAGFIPVVFIPTKSSLIEKQSVYLYRLLIFEALKATRWLPRDLIPSTVAAAWSRPSDHAPLTVVFACACVGRGSFARK